MKSSAASIGKSARNIIARIQKVQKAAEKAAKNERRFADYRYLRSVLAAYTYFEDNNLLPHLVAIAPSMLTTPVRADSCPLRVIIDATCIQPDLRMRSRWTRALEFAAQEQIEPQALARFMSAHSGISGCADLASKTKPKRARQKSHKPAFHYSRPNFLRTS